MYGFMNARNTLKNIVAAPIVYKGYHKIYLRVNLKHKIVYNFICTLNTTHTSPNKTVKSR